MVTFFLRVSTVLFSFHFHFLRFFSNTFCYICWISCFISCFHVFVFCQACSAWPVKSVMLGFLGSSLKFSSFPRKAASLIDVGVFFQSYMKKLQSICSWIRFLISLVQFLLLIMVELFRFNFSAFPHVCWILGCMLHFWVVLLYCDDLCLMWFAVYWLAPGILCLQI